MPGLDRKTVAALTVLLGAKTEEFEKGMKKGKSEIKDFAETAKKMAKAAVAAFAAVGTAAIVAANKAAEYADKIDKTAISTGLSRDTLQKLAYVADQAGVAYESVSSSVAKLNRAMGDAAYGNKRQVEAFEKLGISIYGTDGHLLDMETMFMRVISALNAMPNETERNALAFDLLGRSASQTVPLLAALGDKGITELSEKAERLHLIMNDQGIATLVKYKDDMSTLKQQFGAIIREGILPFAAAFTERLLPVMTKFLEKVSIWQAKRLVESMEKEQIQLNTLVTALISANDNERLRAGLIDEINKKYPDFLKGLSDEETTVKNIRDRLKEANEQYTTRIRLLALEAESQETIAEGIKLRREEKDLALEMTRIATGQNQWRWKPPGESGIYNVDWRTGEKSLKSIKEIAEYFKDLRDIEILGPSQIDPAVNVFVKRINALGEKYLRIQNEIQDNAERYASLIQESQEVTKLLNDLINQSGDLTGARGEPSKPGEGAIESRLTPRGGPLKFEVEYHPEGIQQATADMEKLDTTLIRTKGTIMDFSNTVQNAFTNMAISMAESIGHMISGSEGYDTFFSNIADSFGRFAQEIGAMMIAYGAAVIAFEEALSKPWQAIAAGVALVAIGTVLRDALASPKVGTTAAAGGATYGGSYAGGSSTKKVELVWRRAGQDLVATIGTELFTTNQVFMPDRIWPNIGSGSRL